MLITGIRHAINSELDIRRSAVFMKYLIHYLKMFAFIGMILPVVICVDYFCDSQTKDEIVTNKYYQIIDNLNQIEYYFNTGSHRFLSDIIFYENTNVGNHITFHLTPIFKTVTNVSHQSNRIVYICKPTNIYGWPIIIVGLTFICSIFVMIKTMTMRKKTEYIEYDSKVNVGIINAILCVFTIIATYFHILH